MSTKVKPELSKKNKYWIPKHRFYELKHFCLQYSDWKREYLSLTDPCSKMTGIPIGSKESIEWSDRTADVVVQADWLSNRMHSIEKAAKIPDDVISRYVFKAVTEGLTYTALRMIERIPCGRETFYKRYRRFFWILDKLLRSPDLQML